MAEGNHEADANRHDEEPRCYRRGGRQLVRARRKQEVDDAEDNDPKRKANRCRRRRQPNAAPSDLAHHHCLLGRRQHVAHDCKATSQAFRERYG